MMFIMEKRRLEVARLVYLDAVSHHRLLLVLALPYACVFM